MTMGGTESEKAMTKQIDMTGRRIGRLTVLAAAGRMKNGNRRWLCRCDCGNEVTVDGYALRVGTVKSCGCLRRDASKQTARANPAFLANVGNSALWGTVAGTNLRTFVSMRATNRSGVTGVSYDNTCGKWIARLYFRGRLVLNKSFWRFDEAVQARRLAEKHYVTPLLEQYEPLVKQWGTK